MKNAVVERRTQVDACAFNVLELLVKRSMEKRFYCESLSFHIRMSFSLLFLLYSFLWRSKMKDGGHVFL